MALLERYPDHFVTGPHRLVPRPVLRRENVATIFGGELSSFVERHLERRVVRLQQHIRRQHLGLQLRMLPLSDADPNGRPYRTRATHKIRRVRYE